MITGIRRVVKAGFVGFWRNAYVSFSSIYVIIIALFVIGSSIFADQLLSRTIDIVTSRVDVNVYFVPDASDDDIAAVQTAVSALPEVEEVSLTSREEALEIFRERNQDDAISLQALEELGENPLGAALTIQATDISQYEGINAFLEEQRDAFGTRAVIDTINFSRNQGSIESLELFIETFETATTITLLVLLGAAALITFNTISLAIYTAREEISVMRLVGASNMFIRGPFLLQGMLYGFVAAIITMLIFYPLLVWLGPSTELFFNLNLLSYFIANFGTLFGVLAGIGIVLGLVSSALAIARYLRT